VIEVGGVGFWEFVGVGVGVKVGIVVDWGARQQCQIWPFLAAPRSGADLIVVVGGIRQQVGLKRWFLKINWTFERETIRYFHA
jgi:hypothetical protein